MTCKEHPNYGGLRIPRSGCVTCMDIYNEKHAKKEEVKPVIVIPEPPKKKEKKEKKEIVEYFKEENSGTIKCIPIDTKEIVAVERKITMAEALETLGETVNAVIDEILAKRLAEARMTISRELAIEYEHLWVHDNYYTSAMLKNLENEGWQMTFYSYPLGKNGILPGGKEHFTFKRLKRKENKPVPDFEDISVRQAYQRIK